MYELKKMERYLRVNMLGPGPRLVKKRIYRAAVSRILRNTVRSHKHCARATCHPEVVGSTFRSHRMEPSPSNLIPIHTCIPDVSSRNSASSTASNVTG